MAEDSAKKMKLSSYKVGVNAVILMVSTLVPGLVSVVGNWWRPGSLQSAILAFTCGWNCCSVSQPSYEKLLAVIPEYCMKSGVGSQYLQP